jgi:hypothetical protein
MSAATPSPEAVLQQIDAIMLELGILRQTVESMLLPDLPDADQDDRPSAWDIIVNAPGRLQFDSAEAVNRYLREEREAWDD